MNKLGLSVIATSVFFAVPAFAEDAHHPEKAVAAQAANARPAAPVKKMQDNLTRMQSQLDRLGKAKTDEERRKLVSEHLQAMQENMKMARDMMAGMAGCPMMGAGQGMMQGGMMHGGAMMGDAAQPGAAGERLQQMEKRMDMMQMMMEQMLRRQGAFASPALPAPMQ